MRTLFGMRAVYHRRGRAASAEPHHDGCRAGLPPPQGPSVRDPAQPQDLGVVTEALEDLGDMRGVAAIEAELELGVALARAVGLHAGDIGALICHELEQIAEHAVAVRDGDLDLDAVLLV